MMTVSTAKLLQRQKDWASDRYCDSSSASPNLTRQEAADGKEVVTI